ncbi:MAG: 3-dehydroquinate synthase [Fidelibacterota bacterium]
MKTIQVNLDTRSYPIHIESGLIKQISTILSERNQGQKWVIISQKGILSRYGTTLNELLYNQGFDAIILEVTTGEKAKSFSEYQKLISRMVASGCDRSTTILALGGGVTGDLAGFTAATFMRGIDYYHIPTTLLAMVDSSIGGKTGINIPEGKNLVGSIYQPKGVLIDPDMLHSLPGKEKVSGLGEIIKYGAIYDKEFLINISEWLNQPDSFPFEKAIIRSCQIKADIVVQDEREDGLRRILNFGHTIGHALEAYLGYGKIRHGEAVSLGMVCAGWISNQLGLLSSDGYTQLKETIQKLPLPLIQDLNNEHVLSYVKNDKKTVSGKLHFVVLNELGSAKTTDGVSDDLIIESLKEIQ